MYSAQNYHPYLSDDAKFSKFRRRFRLPPLLRLDVSGLEVGRRAAAHLELLVLLLAGADDLEEALVDLQGPDSIEINIGLKITWKIHLRCH